MSNQGKIAIIGAGHVGSHCAMSLAAGAVSREIVLIDRDEPKAVAQVLDISDALSFPPSTSQVRAGSYSDCADADIVVIAIGEPRLPGQTQAWTSWAIRSGCSANSWPSSSPWIRAESSSPSPTPRTSWRTSSEGSWLCPAPVPSERAPC